MSDKEEKPLAVPPVGAAVVRKRKESFDELDLGLPVRNEVLSPALIMEGMTSAFLAGLLGIKTPKDSRVLGNKSSSISFNQKIDFLIEIGALGEENRKKYQAFMEIRNQFMHNLEADSYEKCFSYLEGKDTFLLRLYKQPEKISREMQLQGAVKELIKELLPTTTEIIKEVEKKIKANVDLEVLESFQKAFFDSMKELEPLLDKYFQDELQKGTTISTERVEGFRGEIMKMVFRLMKNNFMKLTS